MGFMDKVGGFLQNPFGLTEGVTTHLTGGAPAPSYLGGTPEAQEAGRTRLNNISDRAAKSGEATYATGTSMLGDASSAAYADRSNALGLSGQGQMLGNSGVTAQNQAIANARGVAAQQGPSAAQAQMQMGLDQSQRAMMAQAAGARGGNQAAAMQMAQATGSNMANQVNQQAGILRAQEQQAAMDRQLGVEQMAAGYGGQQAGLGYGMQTQGMGLAQGSTKQVGDIGANMTSAGLGQQNIGLGGLNTLADRDKAVLDSDRGNASATTAANSPAAAFGSVLGGVTSLWGGGGK